MPGSAQVRKDNVPQRSEEATSTLRDYLRVVWIRKWLVLDNDFTGQANGAQPQDLDVKA